MSRSINPECTIIIIIIIIIIINLIFVENLMP
jgi:hypothetical protein